MNGLEQIFGGLTLRENDMIGRTQKCVPIFGVFYAHKKLSMYPVQYEEQKLRR